MHAGLLQAHSYYIFQSTLLIDVCVFTDASERGWGLIVTQVRE